MDLLVQGAFTGLGVIILRVALAFALGILVYRATKPLWEKYVFYKENVSPFPSLRAYFLMTIAAFAALALLIYSFAHAAYLPKQRVVDQTNTEQVQAEQKRVDEQLALPQVTQSEADKKAAERKSDINIREKYEQLPNQ